ncbi:MAG: YdcF family protein, partial [Hyphomicrobiaceae bacterium]
MLFALSKILGFLALPSTLLWLMLIAGLARARSYRALRARSGRRLAALAATFMLVAGLTPLASWLLVPLENRFPVLSVAEGSRDYAGIIVLGGGEDGRASVLRGQLNINEAGDRITEGVVLARRLPEAKLVFTGGVGTLIKDEPGGAAAVGAYWRAAGVAEERIVIESRSRNTVENAVLTRALLSPKPDERFLLVTSAAHMPRSVGVFRKAGFDVVAYPVDYRTNFPDDALEPFGSIPAGLKRLDEAAKEWIGL